MAYNLPVDYNVRFNPIYFNDTLEDSHLWQTDVYRLASKLAHKVGAKRLIDIGCGRGKKLISYAQDFEDIVGYDYGENIDYCKLNYPNGKWHSVDLETQIIGGNFHDSVVICADVIEHLITPGALIETLRNAAKHAAYVLVSTPDRQRLYSDTNHSPPDNKAHVREWTLAELEGWFGDEGLPVRWAGWTISYDKQSDHVNTSLIILSQHTEPIETPITFQPAAHWRKAARVSKPLLKVWMSPTPMEAGRDPSNSIHNIVCRLDRYLPDYGVELVEGEQGADLYAGHAGQGGQHVLDVCHYHGVYPTSEGFDSKMYYGINKAVIHNLRTALAITAPSEWIADVLRRDMHVNPHIIPWAVDTEEWTPKTSKGEPYVIWNKARVDPVSDPQPMLELAARAHNTLFLTTFGNGTPNVKAVGRQPYEMMKDYVRGAAVYLSTNVETFGIGTLEAMAAGIPVLAFRQGNTDNLIQHGITGFLAELGDMDGLYEGLLYCLKYRKVLGENAREAAKRYPWTRTAQAFADLYLDVVEIKRDIRPHKIDESLYRV